ncbi:hypothetical protein PFICI_04434 [Pestalotiopsis fici W106-1]|uniref:Arrestin-like N-terminal domain-containing protein n=1 Tax=Pestalotiopsis fici (strain W106-1 / CGMCC3.15140) TaxID=1229662 RepID=W3X8V7_PESFW|nr:uncharacterized protein PFICI_04434 [Pestalotiopsis fici W106-1]ETS82558.1 hypothetical protein PFICI_04434 [Pestalotiopsis fici W106-1]
MFSSSGQETAAVGNVTQMFAGIKSNMTIQLDNHYATRVYTSASSISGHTKIQVAKDTPFDKVQILLLGTTKTRMDGVRAPHTTSHTFLKLEMPIPDSSYPGSRIYRAGQTYDIPFNFVVPNQLTINACNHKVDTSAVHDTHLNLPPSMGPWSGQDDMSPEMARVEYCIVARVLAEEDRHGKRARILEASQQIRVLPAHAEHAPLAIGPKDAVYKMSKSKTMRKSLLSGKVGKVTVSAKQPGAIMLSPDGATASKTVAHVDLVFDPASAQSLPPRVIGVSSKVTALTYYCNGAIRSFPNMGDWTRVYGADSRGSYPTATSISAIPIDNCNWQQSLKGETRRGSTYSADTASTNGSDILSDTDRSNHDESRSRRGSKDSTKYASPVYHTASLKIPIELPTHKKTFIPSFHSCIASRAYVLWMTVSLSCSGNSYSIMVGVPLQVGVESSDAVLESLEPPSFETAVQEAEIDDFLRPRSLVMPDVVFERHGLPGYADLMSGRMVAVN